MTAPEIYEKNIDCFRTGLALQRTGAPYTLTIVEYSNLFEFSIKVLKTKPTKALYKENEKFALIEEIINYHDAYLLLNFSSLVRHDIVTGVFNACQLEPIMVLFKQTTLTVEEKNILLKNPWGFNTFMQDNISYEAKLLIKTKPDKTGWDIDVLFPENLIFTDDLASLKSKSILPITISPNNALPAYISNASYFMNDDTNEITVVNRKKLIAKNFQKDGLELCSSNIYNNSILVHADHNGGGYLHECYYRGTVWFNLTGDSILYHDLKEASYNYR